MTSAGGVLGQILTKGRGLRGFGTDRGGGQNPKNLTDVIICERSLNAVIIRFINASVFLLCIPNYSNLYGASYMSINLLF